MRFRRRLTAAMSACLIAGVAPSVAVAAPVSDWWTGLAVDPPSGYAAQKIPPRGRNKAIFQVKRADDRDTGCQVGFAPSAANGAFTQAGVNFMTRSKEYRALADAVLGVFFVTRSRTTFRHGDIEGVAMVSDFKVRPGYPARAKDIRNYVVLLETPKGRTSVVCVGEKASFAKRRAEFEAVARGTTPPR